MEPIKYVAIRFYERNLGDHGELWQEVYEIRENETVTGLMARLPTEPPTVYVELREVKP